MMSQLRDMEHREMVDELNRKISQLEIEVTQQQTYCNQTHHSLELFHPREGHGTLKVILFD